MPTNDLDHHDEEGDEEIWVTEPLTNDTDIEDRTPMIGDSSDRRRTSADDDEDTNKDSYIALLKRSPDFTKLWLAACISSAGDWFTLALLAGMIESYSASTSYAGFAITFYLIARTLPPMLSSSFGGVLLDRYDRRTLLIGSSVARAALAPFYLLATGPAWLPLIYGVTCLMNLFSGIYEPGESALIPSLVDGKKDAVLANTFMSVSWSFVAAFGAMLGGYCSSVLGKYASIGIDTASFIVGSLLVYFISPNTEEKLQKDEDSSDTEQNTQTSSDDDEEEDEDEEAANSKNANGTFEFEEEEEGKEKGGAARTRSRWRRRADIDGREEASAEAEERRQEDSRGHHFRQRRAVRMGAACPAGRSGHQVLSGVARLHHAQHRARCAGLPHRRERRDLLGADLERLRHWRPRRTLDLLEDQRRHSPHDPQDQQLRDDAGRDGRVDLAVAGRVSQLAVRHSVGGRGRRRHVTLVVRAGLLRVHVVDEQPGAAAAHRQNQMLGRMFGIDWIFLNIGQVYSTLVQGAMIDVFGLDRINLILASSLAAGLVPVVPWIIANLWLANKRDQ